MGALLQRHLPGELLPGCSGQTLAEALRAVLELEQLGRRHSVSTPRLSFLRERLAPLSNEGKCLDGKDAVALLKDIVSRTPKVLKQSADDATTVATSASEASAASNLASTLVVS